MSKRLTPWFPDNVKPVHDGVYAIKFPDGSGIGDYAFFSKGVWGYAEKLLSEAEPYDGSNWKPNQDKLWRGLAKKP